MVENSDTYDQETFVHEEKEVFKTGREAIQVKVSRSGRKRTKKLVEICPLSMREKDNKMYHKWVNEDDLYHVVPEGEQDD